MPPKRSSPDSDGGAAKKTKTKVTAGAPKDRFSKPISATRNVYKDYQSVHGEGKGYRFKTTCVPASQRVEESEDEDEEEEGEDGDEEEEGEDENDKPKYPVCDGGKTCICGKSPEEHPNHPWVVSQAGWAKFYSCLLMVFPRNPDMFGMHTYSDHAGYGSIEITENLLLDYVEAKDNLREQWAICEAMAHWLQDEDSFTMLGVDGPEQVENAIALAGRMVLTTLARIERENLIAEVPSLRVILALWLGVPIAYRRQGLLEDSDDDGTGFDPARFDDYILAWAKKHNIALRGPNDLDKHIAACKTVQLPKATSKKNDPFGFNDAYKEYKNDYAVDKSIGGDKYDITTWSSAERKEASYKGNKDPLTKRALDRLKAGMVMSGR